MKAAYVLGALAAFLSVDAMAADVSLPLKAPASPAVFSWTGGYIGANAGYSWGHTDLTNVASTGAVGHLAFDPAGFLGGAQAGFNWQTGPWVLGIEADIAARHATTDLTTGGANGTDFTDTHVAQTWVGTLRPRVGYAFNNWLVYATGGLAVGGLEHSLTQRRTTVAAANRTLSEDDVRAGWTVGGGVEVAVAPHWSVGAEYLYMDFGSSTLSFPVQVLGGVTFPASTHTFADTSQVARAKVNYRF